MANEAGPGCVDRTASTSGYTCISYLTNSVGSGSIDKYRIYYDGALSYNVEWSFMTRDGTTFTLVDGSETGEFEDITAQSGSQPCWEAWEGTDFTDNTGGLASGTYLACYFSGAQELLPSGGDGLYRSPTAVNNTEDNGSVTFNDYSTYDGGFGADVSAGGGRTTKNTISFPLGINLGMNRGFCGAGHE